MTDSVQDDITKLIDHLGPLVSQVRKLQGTLADFEERIRVIQQKLNHVWPQIVPPDERSKNTAITSIREFTGGAKRLTIVDPYIYKGERRLAEQYRDEFVRACRLDGNRDLKSVHVVYDEKKTTKIIREKIRKHARECGVAFSDTSTTAIHDRIWIK